MARTTLCITLLCACAACAVAQAGVAPRLAIVNCAGEAAEVRVGEESSPALGVTTAAARSASPFASVRPGEHAVYYRLRGQTAWDVLRQISGEGEEGVPRRIPFVTGSTHALVVWAQDGMVGADCRELSLAAGTRPKVVFTALTMGPPRSAFVGPAGAPPATPVAEDIVQYQLSGPHVLGAAGRMAVWFQWPAFYDTATHALEDPKQSGSPALFEFLDGGIYLVLLERFDESGVSGQVFSLMPAGPPAPAAGPRPAPVSTLNGVPEAWYGDWALEARPARKALTIRDGKIYLVNGRLETETFPGTGASYTFLYRERDVVALLDGRMYERYVLSPDGSRLTHQTGGKTEIYVRMKG